MKAIQLTGDIDENHRLRAEVPEGFPAGPVQLIVLIPEEDDAGMVWSHGIAKHWAAELNDPRADIYTLDDGRPLNACEVYLAYFPFGDVPGMKSRPVLLLTESIGPVPEILVAYISSVIPAQVLPSDYLIDPRVEEFRSTDLKVRSTLRLHKLATVHGSSLARYLGKLEAPAQSVAAFQGV